MPRDVFRSPCQVWSAPDPATGARRLVVGAGGVISREAAVAVGLIDVEGNLTSKANAEGRIVLGVDVDVEEAIDPGPGLHFAVPNHALDKADLGRAPDAAELEKADDLEGYPRHVGGPNWELSDGTRVKGDKATAVEAQGDLLAAAGDEPDGPDDSDSDSDDGDGESVPDDSDSDSDDDGDDDQAGDESEGKPGDESDGPDDSDAGDGDEQEG